MMRHSWASASLLGFVALASAPAVPSAVAGGEPTKESSCLCDALSSVRPGESRPVVVSGVFRRLAEDDIFYDPECLTCARSVQPFASVKLGASCALPPPLAELLADERRAHVLVRGTLLGPGEAGPDDPSLPWAASVMLRTKDRRYGSWCHIRTRLVIEEVLEFQRLDFDTPALGLTEPKPTAGLPPLPVAIAPPSYPRYLRKMQLEGKAVLRVTVETGSIKTLDAVTGDSLLVHEAKVCLKEWRFSETASASFEMTFDYDLEDWSGPQDLPARVELRLPTYVRITAPRYDW